MSLSLLASKVEVEYKTCYFVQSESVTYISNGSIMKLRVFSIKRIETYKELEQSWFTEELPIK